MTVDYHALRKMAERVKHEDEVAPYKDERFPQLADAVLEYQKERDVWLKNGGANGMVDLMQQLDEAQALNQRNLDLLLPQNDSLRVGLAEAQKRVAELEGQIRHFRAACTEGCGDYL